LRGVSRFCDPAALYHISSLSANLLTFACLGGPDVPIPDPRNLDTLIATMRRKRVTAVSGVNTLLNALVNRPDVRQLRKALW
jgi:long-chain acyl-CoA synthetase